jgi:hypothetical protein
MLLLSLEWRCCFYTFETAKFGVEMLLLSRSGEVVAKSGDVFG